MNLQQLEYILALDEYRHFGRAAEHCNVSQPTLSTMVQKLEDELGSKIFERNRAAITPTTVGRRILDQAAIILRQTALLSEIVHDETTSLGGSLSMGILPTVAPYLLPRLSPLLSKELPELSISFGEMLTEECVEALQTGQIDMAIIALDEFPELKTSELYFEEFFGYVSSTLPIYQEQTIRSSEVDIEQLWLLDEGHCFRDQLLKFCHLRQALKPRYSYRKGSLQTFIHMVEHGQGMTFIPELCKEMIAPEHQQYVRPFSLPRPCRGIYLATRKDYARQTLAEALIKLVRQAVPERMHRLQAGQHLV